MAVVTPGTLTWRNLSKRQRRVALGMRLRISPAVSGYMAAHRTTRVLAYREALEGMVSGTAAFDPDRLQGLLDEVDRERVWRTV